MTVNDIQNLIDLMQQSPGVAELSVTASDGSEVTVKRPVSSLTVALPSPGNDYDAATASQAGGDVALASSEPAEVLSVVASTMVGIFHTSSPPVEAGTELRAGQRVGSIESIKLMNDVVSTASGVVVEVLIEDGQPVEYGQVLYRVSPRTLD